MSQITEFFNRTGFDSEGRNLDEILSKPLHWMEAAHDYVQWLFPLRNPSNFNPDAPLLTDEDVKILSERNKPTFGFLEGCSKFLYFLVIQDIWILDAFDGFELADNFEQQKWTWLEFNHNALRITRMLTCLSILGFTKYAEELLKFMKEEATKRDVVLNEVAVKYWEDALLGDNRKLR